MPPSYAQLMHLTFEDFLEMLVRLASAKAMPTDEELQQAGARDGGAFLLEFRQSPADLDAWLAHATPPGCLAVRCPSLICRLM